MNFGLSEKHRHLYPPTIALLLVFAMVSLVWSQFYPYILQRYSLSDLSPVVLSASLMGLGMLLFTPISGFLADRFGPKPTMAVAGIGYLAGMITISMMFDYADWETARLYWYAGSVIVGIGAGFFIGTYPVVIARWFSENTGKTFGIAIFGQNISPLLFSPLVAFLIVNYSIKTTFVVLGILIFIFFYAIGVALWRVPEVAKKKSESSPALRSDFSLFEALKDPRFWVLFTAMFTTATAWFLILMNVATIISEGLSKASMDPQYIANSFVPLFLGITAVGSAIGSFFWGALNDKTGGPFRVLPVLYASAGIFIVPFIFFYSNPLLVLMFGVLLYFCLGGEPTVHFSAVPTFFGSKYAGRVTGLLNTSVMTSSILGPYLGSLIRDLTRSYVAALYLSAILHFFATAVVLFAVRYLGVRKC